MPFRDIIYPREKISAFGEEECALPQGQCLVQTCVISMAKFNKFSVSKLEEMTWRTEI